MKLMPSRPRPPGLLIAAAVASAALVGAALAQPGGGTGGKNGGAPGGSGPPSNTFVFQVCNKTPDIPVIFVATVQIVSAKEFRATGWSQVAKGQCIESPVLRPRVWIHARASDITWTKGIGQIVPICVNLNTGFDYTWDGRERQCQQGEIHADFVLQEISPKLTLRNLELL